MHFMHLKAVTPNNAFYNFMLKKRHSAAGTVFCSIEVVHKYIEDYERE
jgi:hypothetical protein